MTELDLADVNKDKLVEMLNAMPHCRAGIAEDTGNIVIAHAYELVSASQSDDDLHVEVVFKNRTTGELAVFAFDAGQEK